MIHAGHRDLQWCMVGVRKRRSPGRCTVRDVRLSSCVRCPPESQPTLRSGGTMNAVRIAVMALFAAMATSTAQSNTGPIPGWDGAWEIDPRSGKITEHMGLPAAMLRGNFPPILSSGADFTDGTIEFDMAALPGGNFVGLVFRYADGLNHENIYFRLHRSGAFEAVQYAPRVNG